MNNNHIYGKLRQLAAALNFEWKKCEPCCGMGLARPPGGGRIGNCAVCFGAGEILTPKETE